MIFDPVQRPGYILWQLFHVLEHNLTGALAPFGLSPLQFNAMANAQNEPGISGAEISRRNNVAPQSVQTALKPLVERELLTRRAHPVHGRVIGIYTTPAGDELVTKAGLAVDAVENEVFAGLDTNEIAGLHKLMLAALTAVNPIALDRSSLRSER